MRRRRISVPALSPRQERERRELLARVDALSAEFAATADRHRREAVAEEAAELAMLAGIPVSDAETLLADAMRERQP